jgi:putative ABC transport system permease protein
LLFFLRTDLQEEVLGDLDEKFYSEKSPRRAKLNYWYQVFNYLRPFAMRKKRFHPLTQIDMLKNYLTVAWRNLLKHPMYSTINIGGFAFGIAACALLAIYIHGELSYDKHYVNGDRTFRVVGHGIWQGQEYPGLHFSHPFGDVLKESLPEIEEVGYYNAIPNFGAGSAEIRRTDRVENMHEDKIVYFNQGLLSVLEMQFVHGNPSKALTDPKTVVITESTAIKYFGDEDPVGKSIILNDNPDKVYAITGVVKDFPVHSHLAFDFMLTAEADIAFAGERTSWCCNNYINYIRLRPGVDPKAFAEKLGPLIRTYTLADAKKRNAGATEMTWANSFYYTVQPLSNIYLNTENYYDDLRHGDIRFIWLFGSIAVFILFLACINFINLSTARSASRAKEVGIRKAIGSVRSSVVRQFLAESLMFSFIALVIGLMLAQLMIPFFNNLVGKSLSFPWTQWWLIPSLIGAVLVIGFIAGMYPAFYLSAFSPAKVLKGRMITGARNSTVRSVLVIFQFTISIALIVGTIVIGRQMTYALNKDLGFDKSNLMILHGTVTLGDKNIPLKDELMKLSQVKSVSISNYLPVDDGKRDGGSTTVEGKDGEYHSQQWEVDPDYVKTMGFKIIRGRDFDARLASDSAAMIINESMAKQFGDLDPIGLRVSNYSGKYTIVGIVEDFHFHKLTQQISPVSMFTTRRQANIISIKLQPTDVQTAIEAVSATWKKFSPNQPIRYEFLEDRFVNTYNDVKRFGTIVRIFASLAIIVACLGLFALSAFMIEQRGKEISIRMVLGAPMAHILRLLSQNFMILISISFVVATPVAWYLMNKWLQDYAYKIDITWDVFAMTGVTAMAIALLTIGYQSVKASLTNPVVNLKSE